MIEPYYDHDGVTLYQGDCIDVMMQLPVFDTVITDPPYGIGESSVKNSTRSKIVSVKNYGEYSWDTKLDREYIRAVLNAGNEQVIFGGNYYADWLPASSGWIVWDKLNSGDFADCELIWTSYKRAVRKVTYLWNGMFKQFPEERFHPTQKPLYVMTWIIEKYGGGYIIDPFMGSGTTGVAAVQLGRRFIGIEISPEYCEIARKRIAQAQLQIRMDI